MKEYCLQHTQKSGRITAMLKPILCVFVFSEVDDSPAEETGDSFLAEDSELLSSAGNWSSASWRLITESRKGNCGFQTWHPRAGPLRSEHWKTKRQYKAKRIRLNHISKIPNF